MEYKLALSNIKTLLKMRGRSITSLAVDMELSNETLSRYINGQRQPKLEIVIKLANKLNTTTDYILGLTDEPNKLSADLSKEESLLLLNYRSLDWGDRVYVENYVQAMVDVRRRDREKVVS